MQIDGLDWVLAPHVGLVDRMDVLLQSHLSVDVKHLLWRDQRFKSIDGSSGHVTLALDSSSTLFTPLSETTQIGEHESSRMSASEAIAAERAGVQIIGRLDDQHRVKLRWAASDSGLCRNQTWGFGYALRVAISLCTGCGASVLERELQRQDRVYREVIPYQKPSRLGSIHWFEPFKTPNAEECLELSLALSQDPVLLDTAWGAFSQLLASQEQRAWGLPELLVAIALEGLLRSLEGRPFEPGDWYDAKKSLSALRKTRFPSVTNDECDAAIEAYKRLRHRNAHPDWLTTDQRLSRDELTRSSADKSLLSKLYGRILFEVAGLPEVASRIRPGLS